MTKTDKFQQIEVSSPKQLVAWLDDNHAQDSSVWLVTFKKHVADKYVSRDEVLDALVAYGWVDGIRRKRDDDRTMQLISPRKQQAWARSYKLRAERLEAAGKMHSAGRASVRAGKASGLWEFSDDVDDLVVPEDLAEALRTQQATEPFAALAPSYRRNVLRWIKSAKRRETRAKRVAALSSATARGEKIPQF